MISLIYIIDIVLLDATHNSPTKTLYVVNQLKNGNETALIITGTTGNDMYRIPE